ncbi:protein of unknown function [Paraburkholderia kururiensis]
MRREADRSALNDSDDSDAPDAGHYSVPGRFDESTRAVEKSREDVRKNSRTAP